MRRFLIVFLLVPLIAVTVAYAGLKILIKPEEVRDWITGSLSRQIGVEITLGQVKPSLWPFGVRIADAQIANPAPDADAPFATLESGEISLRLRSLLKKQIELSGASLHGLALTIVRDENGELVLSLPGKSDSGAPGEAESPEGQKRRAPLADFALLLSSAQIDNSSLRIVDRATGLEHTIRNIELSTDLQVGNGGNDVAARGVGFFEGIVTPEVPEGVPLLIVEYDLEVKPAAGTLSVRTAAVKLGDLGVRVSGELSDYETSPRGELAIASPGLKIGDLLSLVPASAWSETGPLQATGSVDLAGTVTLRGEDPPAYSIGLDVEGVRVENLLPGPIDDLAGKINVTEKEVRIDGLTASFDGEPFQVNGTVVPAEDPGFDLRIDGGLDLALVAKLGMLPPGSSLAGFVTADLRAQKTEGDPRSLAMDGTADVKNMRFASPDLGVPIENVNGKFRLSGDVIRADSISMKMGRTKMRASLTASDPFGTPNITLSGSANVIDLDQLFPVELAERKTVAAAGAPAGTVSGAPAAPIVPPLPNVRASGTFRADSVYTGGNKLAGVTMQYTMAGEEAKTDLRMKSGLFGAVAVQDASGDITVKGGVASGPLKAAKAMAGVVPLTNASANLRAEGDRVEIRGLRASVYQGSLTGDVTVTLDAKRVPTYEAAMKAKDWEANDFLTDLTPAKNILYGKFEMDSEWSGRGVLPEEALKNLKGSGKATTLNGELRNLEALNAVANLLGMNELKQQKFRSMFTNFEVKDGKLHTDEVTMQSTDADWRATGGVSFAGDLDYVISATLSPALSQKLKQKQALTGLLANSEGRIVLDFVVKGDTKKPKVSFDPTKSAAANGSNAIGAILESVDKDGAITGAINDLLSGGAKDAGKTVDKFLGGFLNKKKPAEPKAIPDSAETPQ